MATRPEYYSPLSSNSFENGVISPSYCAFSSPKVPYSQETRDYVQLLMNETKLSTTQRRGFESLLRSHDPTVEPESTARARRQEYLRRRVDKGRALGLEIPSGLNVNKIKHGQGLRTGGCRRSLETIKASGDFQAVEQPPKKYIPVNKEAEKARLSYKMAYGEEPTQEIMNHLLGSNQSKKPKDSQRSESKKSDEDLKQERLNELIEEIRERVEFMETMKEAKRDKDYRASMTFQIRAKLDEVKGQFPEKVKDLVHQFHLEEIDPNLAKN